MLGIYYRMGTNFPLGQGDTGPLPLAPRRFSRTLYVFEKVNNHHRNADFSLLKGFKQQNHTKLKKLLSSQDGSPVLQQSEAQVNILKF